MGEEQAVECASEGHGLKESEGRLSFRIRRPPLVGQRTFDKEIIVSLNGEDVIFSKEAYHRTRPVTVNRIAEIPQMDEDAGASRL
jgi:hypothetical protein